MVRFLPDILIMSAVGQAWPLSQSDVVDITDAVAVALYISR